MQSLRVCHLAMGDLWAGAEVQLAALVAELIKQPDLRLAVVLFNEGKLACELRAVGVPVTVFPESEWGAMRIARALAEYCRSSRFDLLHTHKYKDNLIGAWAAARCGIKHIVRTIHGLSEPFGGVEALKMRLYDRCDDIAIRWKVDRLIAVSSQIEEVLAARYGRQRVVQIHNGIRLGTTVAGKAADAIRADLGLRSTDRLIGTVGRLTAVKGHIHFLAMAERLAKVDSGLYFVVVGDGPLIDHLKGRAQDLGISDRVRFVGHRDDTFDFMRAMDIFVLPSLHEGIPMVILEAMALGRPVVASRVGGIPEVITDSVHGLLVPAGDSHAMAEACEKFLTNQKLADACGRAGRTRVEEKFSSRAMGEKVANLYRELVATPG